MRVLALALTVLSIAAIAHAAEPSEDERIARAYLDAYSAIDTAAMARFLHDEVVFADQTAPKSQGGPHVMAGRDVFLAKLKSFGLGRIDYELTRTFESNGRTVFVGNVTALYPRSDGTRLRWRAAIVTVVTVENGKVVRHDDYADYRNATQVVERP